MTLMLGMTDEELLEAVVLHFGGRARAEHIVRCDDCHHDNQGDFIPCGRCPQAGERRAS